MTKGSHLHLEPSKLNDSSTGTSGVVASEIAAEEELLLNHEQEPSYQATDSVENESESTGKDNYNGYALPRSKLILVCCATYSSSFLNALDATVVSTLLPVIASDLNQIPNMSWIATSYLLSSAAFQPLYGKISDIFGRKPVLLMCCAIFIIGCSITSYPTFTNVVVGRFITGMGGSGFNVVGTIAMSDIVPLRDRGMFQGLANLAYLFGAASGGILGGLINDWLGWPWVFGLQVPVMIVIGILYHHFFHLPEGSPGLGSPGHIKEKLKRVDFVGSFFLVLSLIVFMLAASMGNQYFSYTSWTFFVLIITALVLLAIFIYVELYVAPEPILPITLMSEATILASSLTNWFATMSSFTYIFYYPLFLSTVMLLPSSEVGLRVVSNFVGVAFGSLGAGIYMRQTGKYYKLAVLSSFLLAVGVLAFCFLTSTTSVYIQMVMMIVPGFSYAVILTVTLLALIAAAPVKQQAGTTSIQYTFRSTGSTLGVSVASAIFQAVLKKTLNSRIPKAVSDPKTAAKIIEHALNNAEYTRTAPEAVKSVIVSCYEAASKGAFHFAFAMGVLAFFSTIFMREHALHSSLDRD